MQTREERLAMIKASAAKFQKKQVRQARINREENYSDPVAKPKKLAHEYAWAHSSDNINHWTDAEKYADQYYGDTYRATTRFDNDWD